MSRDVFAMTTACDHHKERGLSCPFWDNFPAEFTHTRHFVYPRFLSKWTDPPRICASYGEASTRRASQGFAPPGQITRSSRLSCSPRSRASFVLCFQCFQHFRKTLLEYEILHLSCLQDLMHRDRRQPLMLQGVPLSITLPLEAFQAGRQRAR